MKLTVTDHSVLASRALELGKHEIIAQVAFPVVSVLHKKENLTNVFFALLALGYTAVSVRLVRTYLQRRRRAQRMKRRSERITSRDMARLCEQTREKTKFIRSQEAHIKILNAMIDRAQIGGR